MDQQKEAVDQQKEAVDQKKEAVNQKKKEAMDQKRGPGPNKNVKIQFVNVWDEIAQKKGACGHTQTW